jgi:plastocyanin
MRRLALFFIVAAALVVAAPASSTTTAQATITTTGFVPRAITIDEGDSVKWTNIDTVNHRIVKLNGRVFSPVLRPGDSFTKTFSSEGVYRYTDASEETMRTVVTVRPTTTQAVTLNASASRVIYGRAFTLSGTVSSGKAGEDVNIVAQRFGESSFTALGTVKTGEDGD